MKNRNPKEYLNRIMDRRHNLAKGDVNEVMNLLANARNIFVNSEASYSDTIIKNTDYCHFCEVIQDLIYMLEGYLPSMNDYASDYENEMKELAMWADEINGGFTIDKENHDE